jgi:hypothetical protein
VIIGAGALALSPFLTWIRVVLFGSLNLFDLASLNGNDATWFPVTIIVSGIAIAVSSLTRSRGAYIFTLVVGLLGGFLGLLVVIGLVNDVDQGEGLAAVGVGPFVGLLALLTIVIASIVGLVADSG